MLLAPPLPPLSERHPQLPCCLLLTPLPPPPSVTLFWSAPMLLRFRSRSPQMNAVAGHSEVSPAHASLTTYLRVSACPRSLPTVTLAAYALTLGRRWASGSGPVLGHWLRRRRRRRRLWRWRRRRRRWLRWPLPLPSLLLPEPCLLLLPLPLRPPPPRCPLLPLLLLQLTLPISLRRATQHVATLRILQPTMPRAQQSRSLLV